MKEIKNHVGYKIQQSGNFGNWSYNVSVDNSDFYIAKLIHVYDVYGNVLYEYYESCNNPILSDKSYKKIAQNGKYYNKIIVTPLEFFKTFKN